MFLGLGPAGRVAAAGRGEPDLGVGGIGDPDEEELQEEVRPGEDPAQEGHQRDVPEAGRDGGGVLGRQRRLVVRGGAGEERHGRGGGEGGEQDEVGAQRVQRLHVRHHHPGRQGHDQDDGDRPDVPVGGASAGPADDREQHPQQLVLPGRGRDGDRGAAGDRDGEEELAVVEAAHGAAQGQDGDGRAERQEERDLQGAAQAEPEQGAVQGLVGEIVGRAAEADARHVVDPVAVGVVRHRRPGQSGARGEGDAGGERGAAAAGEPQQGREEQQGGLERRRDADEQAAGPLAVGGEAAQQDEQDRDDAGLAEPQGVADRQGHHEQADGDRGGQQGRAAADGLGQGPGGDQAEGDDQQQRAEGPAPAEGLFGRTGEGLEDEPAEGCAGEAGGVVERAGHVQHAVRPDPGLQVRQPLPAWAAEDDGHLPGGEGRDDQPQPEAGHAQACAGPADGCRSEGLRRSSAAVRIRHATSTFYPVCPSSSG